MSETAVASTPAAPAQAGTPKKPSGGKSGSKKPRVKPSHPRTSEMVIAAVKNLKERGGSSLQAIKKYISANYKVDAEKLAPFIKKYLKSAVTSGSLVQTKGKGASGSFKLSSAEKGETKKGSAKAASGKKPSAKKLTKKTGSTGAVKTAKSPKKTAKTTSASTGNKGPAKVKKTPSKAKKAKGSPTKKPKAPKPKKATSKPKSAGKKAAPKKK